MAEAIRQEVLQSAFDDLVDVAFRAFYEHDDYSAQEFLTDMMELRFRLEYNKTGAEWDQPGPEVAK